jgi:hypothetical protein
MPCFLISYEPRPGVDFGPLMDEAARLGGVEVQPGRWLIRVEATVADIFAVFERLMPTSFDDSLFISLVPIRPRTTNEPVEVRAWLESNFATDAASS